MAVILITHDLGVVAGIADRINVMYAGYIVESAPAEELFANPRHPYTLGLLRSIPRLDEPRKEKLIPIEGLPPDLIDAPAGLPVRAALHLRGRPLRRGEPVARAGRAGAHDRLLG